MKKELKDQSFQFNWEYRRKILIMIAAISATISFTYSLVLFLLFRNPVSAAFDSVFFLMSLTCLFIIFKGKYLLATYWIAIVIISQITAGVILFIGRDGGFQYYLLTIPGVAYLLFDHGKKYPPIFLSVIGFMMFIACETVFIPGLRLDIPEAGYRIMYLVNTFLVCAGIFIIIQFYSSEQRKLVIFDYLTGLYNRRYIMMQAGFLLSLCKRNNHAISFIMADIDHFKSVNDSYGHQAGDHVLKQVAELLVRNVRECDLVARYGGEEFLLVLPELDSVKATALAERIRSTIAESRFEYDGNTVSITVSLGISTDQTSPDTTIDRLISQSDSALYEAKRGGRNRVTCFNNEGRTS
jgi:diguanylate cyclase